MRRLDNRTNYDIIKLFVLFFLFVESIVINTIPIYCIVFLIFSVVLLIESRRSILMFVSSLIMVYSNYSFVVQRYISPQLLVINTNLFEYDLISIRIMLFFMFSLLFLVLIKNPSIKSAKDNRVMFENSFNGGNNFIIVAICFVVLIFIWMLFYNYSPGEKSGYSPMYEYSLIFFIIGFYYSGTSKFSNTLLVMLALFFVLFDFLGGQRSTGVQVLIVVALMAFTKYLKIRRIILGAFLLLFIITFVALYRGTYSITSISFNSLIEYLKNGGGGYTTAGFAYYTSLTFLGTMQYYSFAERLVQFLHFIASQLVVGTVGLSLVELANQHYVHYFGGVLPIYLFYYLGYLGVFFIAWLVAFYYKKMLDLNFNRTGYKTVISVYIASTTHRWYLYSPNQLIRGVLLLILVFFIFSCLNESIKLKIRPL